MAERPDSLPGAGPLCARPAGARRHVPTIVLMIPLLFEAGLTGLCTEIWLVDCDEQQQLQRMRQRDRLSDAGRTRPDDRSSAPEPKRAISGCRDRQQRNADGASAADHPLRPVSPTEPFGDHPLVALLRVGLLQGEGIGRAIGLKVVPGQGHSGNGRVTAAQALETGFSALLHRVEIHHHRPGALSPLAVCLYSSVSWRKGVGVFLEVLPGVIALTLNRL